MLLKYRGWISAGAIRDFGNLSKAVAGWVLLAVGLNLPIVGILLLLSDCYDHHENSGYCPASTSCTAMEMSRSDKNRCRIAGYCAADV
jgi:hypothetical protein